MTWVWFDPKRMFGSSRCWCEESAFAFIKICACEFIWNVLGLALDCAPGSPLVRIDFVYVLCFLGSKSWNYEDRPWNCWLFLRF